MARRDERVRCWWSLLVVRRGWLCYVPIAVTRIKSCLTSTATLPSSSPPIPKTNRKDAHQEATDSALRMQANVFAEESHQWTGLHETQKGREREDAIQMFGWYV